MADSGPTPVTLDSLPRAGRSSNAPTKDTRTADRIMHYVPPDLQPPMPVRGAAPARSEPQVTLVPPQHGRRAMFDNGRSSRAGGAEAGKYDLITGAPRATSSTATMGGISKGGANTKPAASQAAPSLSGSSTTVMKAAVDSNTHSHRHTSQGHGGAAAAVSAAATATTQVGPAGSRKAQEPAAFASQSQAGGRRGSAGASSQAAAFKPEPSLDDLLGPDPSLPAGGPSSPSKKRMVDEAAKQSLWAELSRTQAALDAAERAAATKAKAEEKARYRQELTEQEAAKKAAAAAAKQRKVQEEADLLRQAAERDAAAASGPGFRPTGKSVARQPSFTNLTFAQRAELLRRREKEQKLASERAELDAAAASAAADAEAAAAKKRAAREEVSGRLADNNAAIAAKRAAEGRQREEDRRQLELAAQAVAQREQRRADEIAARQATVEARIALGETTIMAVQANKEADAAARAERQRAEMEARQDAALQAKRDAAAARAAEVRATLDAQLAEKQAKAGAKARETAEAAAAMKAIKAAAEAETAAKAQRRREGVSSYRADLQDQMASASAGVARSHPHVDASPVERAINTRVLEGARSKLEALSPPNGASTE